MGYAFLAFLRLSECNLILHVRKGKVAPVSHIASRWREAHLSRIELSGREQHEPFRRGNPTHSGHAQKMQDQIRYEQSKGPLPEPRPSKQSERARQLAGFQFKH